ncbi:MAG: site-specific DNA-methyltransferase [Candidatus Thermochlorobacter aerophilum]|uniref:site-specific DNA-methyltransferase (adenine-specific) n=1 Tax=Candidatus Thermochlorobacter aerophilus TaxID=1868324 RepID=A0A395LWG9_9BACT|nr:MAG: site-specific DNA-methyltransferase [Candidatus Thermochlorobacter aerophilum]
MTELLWDGKYKDGKKTSPIRIALPFQTIETLNESATDRQKRLNSLFQQKDDTTWYNRLIWGDKKYVLPSLLPEFAGKVDLIYIDPPFNVGADFSFTTTLPPAPDDGDEQTTFTKEPSIIEQKAYRDTWGRGLDSYLQWFYETVVLLRELLADTGSIYVHLDWHVGHYAKCVLDEVFGYENFRNEIYWYYYNKMPDTRKGVFPRATDTIYWYVKNKSSNYCFNPLTEKRDTPVKQLVRKKVDGKAINARDEEGNVMYQIRDERVVDNVWRLSMLQPADRTENLFYQTQKPEALLDRIIKASSNEGDLVLDCFCGSGTTAAVAEKLGRRWIACDLGRFAIHTTRKRLLSIPNVKPFVVQNLGKYERQAWVQAEFERPESRLEQERAYRKFILELYHATELAGYTWIHGVKSGRAVHVGGVEAPVAVEDVRQMVIEFLKLVGKERALTINGIDVLGWEFAFELNEIAREYAERNGVDVKFKKIPREVLEKKAVEQGDIKFYELAALEVETAVKAMTLVLNLKNFTIPPDDVPPEVQRGITHWSQWIDYWSVDWNYRGDTFHNEWQSYRTKKNPKIELSASHEYEAAGKYTVLVKVIDILGNDTTKALQVVIG